ncbi:CNNM domain-containing protein [Alteromonas sp. C1M14]|uniref:CNNM domain-containing protein n=1 Tax=Alteromonas sp. C1M14 TaxID=2841567 RepID=UPI001C0A188B|nr:CNNM domain-containing protein [Alteromonas sp. C1M14]MBU2977333.1 DUF21 domain-containing protein [Alteromonas sp. C1M14]
MFLLTVYVLIALGFSFLCSIAEAVILSISSAYISVLEKDAAPTGKLLRQLTDNINKPLAAILTLNTIAHTMGAAGAGAQAAVVFGDAYLGVISAILTLLILVFSEIIPKTLGATYWRALAAPTAWFLKYLTFILAPFVWFAEKLTRGFKEDSPFRGLSRNELQAMAELSRQEGRLAEKETAFLQNMLNMHDVKVRDAMTHRTSLFSLSETMTVEAFFHKHSHMEYSRIPIYSDDEHENIHSFVMRSDLLLAYARGNKGKVLGDYQRDMVTVLSSMPLSNVVDLFIERRVHIFMVVDEYGGLEGIVTLEDVLEHLLGIEIVDEKDNTVSIRRYAQNMARRRAAMLMKNVPDEGLPDKE